MSAESGIKVLILDGQRFFREGVRAILDRETDLCVQRDATNLDELDPPRPEPDVVVVDPFSLGLVEEGVGLLQDLVSLLPASNVLVLSEMEEPEVVRQCLAAGAYGYVHKDASVQDLAEAVRKVAAGDDYLHPSLGAKLIRHIPSRKQDPRHPALTPTEREMLRVLALGHTNAEVATMLCYSMRTVEAYRSRLMKKLGAQTRAELVKVAAELDLLHFEVPKGGAFVVT